MAKIAPYAFFQEFDNNGNVLAGGKLYTYESGTTTPKATYTSSDEATQNSNPVILDSSGRANVWLGVGAYTFALYTSDDVLVKTVSNITGESANQFAGDAHSISTNTLVNEIYEGATIDCTASLTLSLVDAATAGAGFVISVKNSSSGNVTIDPDAAELVDGAATLTIPPSYSCMLTCTGAAWKSYFLVPQTLSASGSAGTVFKNSAGATAMTVGASASTNVSIAGGLTLGTALPVASGGTGGTTSETAFSNLAAEFFTDKVIRGLTISNNVSDATNDIDISAGTCVSDDGTTVMKLSAITKRLDAAWAVGTNQGGLDTGSIANTTYHVWAINRPDTGVTDVLFSASASSPTMPTDYTKKKCIGSIIRSGGTILSFFQQGARFYLNTPLITGTATNPGTSAVTTTTGVPLGVKFIGMFQICQFPSTTRMGIYASSLDSADVAPQDPSTSTLSAPGMGNDANGGGFWQFNYNEIRTNTSAQIRTRLAVSSTNDRIGIITEGWIDPRI